MSMWKRLNTTQELAAVIDESHDTPVVIYKHSTRCGASTIVHRRLEADWDLDGEVDIYFLDLISHRDVSDEVARMFGVRHESPQILVIKDGRSIYDTSHGGVSVAAIKKALSEN